MEIVKVIIVVVANVKLFNFSLRCVPLALDQAAFESLISDVKTEFANPPPAVTSKLARALSVVIQKGGILQDAMEPIIRSVISVESSADNDRVSGELVQSLMLGHTGAYPQRAGMNYSAFGQHDSCTLFEVLVAYGSWVMKGPKGLMITAPAHIDSCLHFLTDEVADALEGNVVSAGLVYNSAFGHFARISRWVNSALGPNPKMVVDINVNDMCERFTIPDRSWIRSQAAFLVAKYRSEVKRALANFERIEVANYDEGMLEAVINYLIIFFR